MSTSCIKSNRAAALSPRAGSTCRREREFFFTELMFFCSFLLIFLNKIVKKNWIFENCRFHQFLASDVRTWCEVWPCLEAIGECKTYLEISSIIYCIRKYLQIKNWMHESLSKIRFSCLKVPICCRLVFFSFARTSYYSRAEVMQSCSTSHC